MDKFKFKYKNSSVKEGRREELLSELSTYIKKLNKVSESGGYDSWESSINLPSDNGLLKEVKDLADEKSGPNLKYIVVAGIGGSNLGTLALYKALKGRLHSYKENFPKIIFTDTTDPSLLRDSRKILDQKVEDKEEFLLIVVSKSGTTTETISNFETVFSSLNNHFGDVRDRVVAITDEGSKLWQGAEENNVDKLRIPNKVGGRYSVFSPVGLFPLYLAGIDIDRVLEGARDMRDECLKNGKENIAALSASFIFHHDREGININNNFFFDPDLEYIGKWYRQLMGESIGKKYGTEGEEVNSGITPIVSIGSTDLHSMAQLYFGGPKDKFTTLVYAESEDEEPVVPEHPLFDDLVDGIYGTKMRKIMDAIYGGVKRAYEKNDLPFVEVILEDVGEYELGAYLQFKMIEMMYLAKLLGVNAFNQPNVEDYKDETRKILES